MLEAHDSAEKLIAAICAAPTALQAHGIGKGKNLTSYPAFKEALSADYNYTEVRSSKAAQLVPVQEVLFKWLVQ